MFVCVCVCVAKVFAALPLKWVSHCRLSKDPEARVIRNRLKRLCNKHFENGHCQAAKLEVGEHDFCEGRLAAPLPLMRPEFGISLEPQPQPDAGSIAELALVENGADCGALQCHCRISKLKHFVWKNASASSS